jgi:GTP pyrophosphokinase
MVIGPDNKMVEVQIRNKDMDLTAEKGFCGSLGIQA